MKVKLEGNKVENLNFGRLKSLRQNKLLLCSRLAGKWFGSLQTSQGN